MGYLNGYGAGVVGRNLASVGSDELDVGGAAGASPVVRWRGRRPYRRGTRGGIQDPASGVRKKVNICGNVSRGHHCDVRQPSHAFLVLDNANQGGSCICSEPIMIIT